MARSKSRNEHIATVAQTIDSLLELSRSKGVELCEFLCSEPTGSYEGLADPEQVSAAAGFAEEIAVLLRSVEGLQALQAAAECPKCGYRFLDEASRR